MASFLRLDATDPQGKFHYRIIINVDSISRIDPVGANYCRLVMRESQSEQIYVAGTLEGLFSQILEHSLPPYRAPGR